jgi:rubrerythrin
MRHTGDAGRPGNWYAVLAVSPDATAQQITAAVERLARQANALSITAPERARALRDQIRAIKQDLLSGTEQRLRYDQQLARQEESSAFAPPASAQAQASPHPAARPQPRETRGPGLMSRVTHFLQTGWTCPSCGYGALPTDKFCPKCGDKIQPGLSGRSTGNTQEAETPSAAATTAGPAICARCGASMAADNAFCIRCGARRR